MYVVENTVIDKKENKVAERRVLKYRDEQREDKSNVAN